MYTSARRLQPKGGETQEAQHAVEDAWGLEQAAPQKKGSFAGISDCILLFGAFCNGERRRKFYIACANSCHLSENVCGAPPAGAGSQCL